MPRESQNLEILRFNEFSDRHHINKIHLYAGYVTKTQFISFCSNYITAQKSSYTIQLCTLAGTVTPGFLTVP